MRNQDHILEENRRLDKTYGILGQSSKDQFSSTQWDNEIYPGLNPDALNTSYEDFRKIGNYLSSRNVKSFLDIGFGQGRSFFELEKYFEVIGIEIDHGRVQNLINSEKFKKNHPKAFCLDANKDPLPWAEAYFLYFPTGETLDRIIFQLRQRQKENFWLVAIESHGDLFSTLDEECPWLELVHQEETSLPRHNDSIRFYKSKISNEKDNLRNQLGQLSGKKSNKQILVDDGDKKWLADTLGIDRSFFPKLYSKYPENREFHSSQIIDFIIPKGLLLEKVLERRKNPSFKKIILKNSEYYVEKQLPNKSIELVKI